jgi:ABC-2 type transport system permease protein
MRPLWTMALSDLRQRLRDRSVLIFAVAVPLALMAVLNLVLGNLTNRDLAPVTVAVSAPAGDEAAQALVGTLRSLGDIDGAGGFAVTVQPAPAAGVRQLVADDKANLGVTVPEGFGAALQQGAPKDVVVVDGGSGGIENDIVIAVVTGTVDRYRAATVAASAGGAAGLPAAELAAIGREVATAAPTISLTEGRASDEQLSTTAALVAGQAGLFLLFTVGFGVLGLVNEREQGTLARLRSMPMRPWLIVGAKAVVSFVLGVVATTVLLTAGSLLFHVDFGSPLAVALLVLCAVTAGTSVTFVIARIARTAEQANVAQSIVALVLGIAGGAFFPLKAGGLLGTLLDANPVGAFIRGLGITSGGGGVGDLGVPVLTMLVFAALMVGLSRVIPDRGAAL